MSHSYTSLYYHFVFATQARLKLLPRQLIPELRNYGSGILTNHSSRQITANGEPDHLHVLASLHQTMSVAEGAKLIKANSSRWLSKDKGLRPFSWQDGYAAFTVSRSQVPRVKRYIERQQEHHRKRTFQEELIELFEKHGLAIPEGWQQDG